MKQTEKVASAVPVTKSDSKIIKQNLQTIKSQILKHNAIIIADAHYDPKLRPELYDFLLQFKNQTNLQIIFLGDTFDYLVGFIKSSVERNLKLIQLINKLSLIHEIIIFEGNHDFFLDKLFPQAMVIDFAHQPLHLKQQNKMISLSHGHKDRNFDNVFFYKLLFNKTFLFSVHYLTLNNIFGWINQYFYKKHQQKNHQKQELDLKKILAKKFNIFYKQSDIVLEGHYHQGRALKIKNRQYINAAAFLVKQQVLIFDAENLSFRLKS